MFWVGSTNFDPRSFHLNNEANLNVHDREFMARLTQVFEEDIPRSKRITLEAWQNAAGAGEVARAVDFVDGADAGAEAVAAALSAAAPLPPKTSRTTSPSSAG